MFYHAARNGRPCCAEGLEVGKCNSMRKCDVCIEAQSSQNDRLDAQQRQPSRLVSTLSEKVGLKSGGFGGRALWVYEPQRRGIWGQEKGVNIQDGARRGGLERKLGCEVKCGS